MAARQSDTPYAPGAGEPGSPAENPRPAWRDIDPPPPPAELLERHGALVLDPLTALRLEGAPMPRPTTYLAASMIVPASVLNSDEAFGFLTQALGDEDLTFDAESARREAAQLGELPDIGVAVRLDAAPGSATFGPDAWNVVQRARGHALAAGKPEALSGLGLNHLLFAASHIDGHPVTGMSHIDGHPVLDSSGLAEYVLAGSGGRAPVSWVGQAPHRHQSCEGRRPVVAVLDTGCGKHPWLVEGVTRHAEFNGVQAELDDAVLPDPEVTGDLVGPMDGALDSHSGHGTFIAGLIRQISPDADILALRIMASDGVVQEGDLLQALCVLNGLVARSRAQEEPDFELDILSLSLGYYHQAPDDANFDPLLQRQLQGLCDAGVCVISCAGNDATARPMFPAAFAPAATGDVLEVSSKTLPLLSVGALNPDGSTALFSNGGDWVLAFEVGAALVSTFPVTFNGGAQPSVRVETYTGRPRSTIDPDSFASGFGTWSGTSFSAPVLAARLAQRLGLALGSSAADSSAESCVARLWDAITAETGFRSAS